MSLQIAADRNIPFLSDAIEGIANVLWYDNNELTNDILKEHQTEYIFARTALKANSKLLNGTKVKFTATATSGIDHFDVDWMKENNIYYTSALGSNANSVAEYVIYSILKWANQKHITLLNKTIGIIGYGNVGKRVAELAYRLGLQIIVNDPPLLEKNFQFPNFLTYSNLEDLISQSDIVTNHVPRDYTSKFKTINLLNSNNLTNLKSNSLFIHASRGNVVEEKAIIDLIDTKNLTLVFDVWDNEPYFNFDIAKRCMIATPHIAGHSYEGKIKGTLMNLIEFDKFTGIQTNKDAINRILDEYKPLDESYYNKNQYLLSILNRNRNLEYDTTFLLSLISLDIESVKQSFADFRQKYPIRRETL